MSVGELKLYPAAPGLFWLVRVVKINRVTARVEVVGMPRLKPRRVKLHRLRGYVQLGA